MLAARGWWSCRDAQHHVRMGSILFLAACCSPPGPRGRWQPYSQGMRPPAARPTTHCSSEHPWVLQVWRMLTEIAWAPHIRAV